MPKYAAFLRGVMPTNARMPDLKQAFEAAGFAEVRTVLSSGNLVFEAARASIPSLERRAEAAMQQRLGKAFLTIIRPITHLRELLASDPYRGARIPEAAKRVVTFLRAKPPGQVRLPSEGDGARIVAVRGGEVFTAYLRTPKGPVFMTLLEKTFGREQTTRTWQTVQKVASL
jgi:uncharacterized protein (DUF1697 family)